MLQPTSALAAGLALFWLSSAEWVAQRIYKEVRCIGASAEIHYGIVTVGAGMRIGVVTAGKPKRQTQNSQGLHCVFFSLPANRHLPRVGGRVAEIGLVVCPVAHTDCPMNVHNATELDCTKPGAAGGDF
jgi:hypothetical protein